MPGDRMHTDTADQAPRRGRAPRLLLLGLLLACGSNTQRPPPPSAPTVPPAPGVSGPSWQSFGRSPQHTADSAIATQDLNRIGWLAPVDLAPQVDSNGELLVHYGAPIVSAFNTVVLPVKTGAAGGFRLEARSGVNGGLIWSADSDWAPPPHDWLPGFNPTLTNGGRVYFPGAGGRLLFRDAVDSASGPSGAVVFYGASTYAVNVSAFDGSVFVDTPITADAAGDVFFGFAVTGPNPAGLSGGVARVDASGNGTWVSAATIAGDSNIVKAAMNSSPALSNDGATLYVAVNSLATGGPQKGYLAALDSTTLAVKARVLLVDPLEGTPASVDDNGTASPTVGPDGQVYFGVEETIAGTHNGRGWLLHFDAALGTSSAPGGFGWDITPSVVPASMVPGYAGPSSYLLMTKYNNYLGVGTGDGQNRVAVLDPSATETDPISGKTIMREVVSILGPTAEGSSGARKEWCINTAAVDPATGSVLVNSEDGYLYRWSLAGNSFTQRLQLTSGIGEAYTPTVVGADGAVYAISNSVLFSVAK
jgi:hypothetical protein